MGNIKKMKMAVNPVYPYAWDDSLSLYESMGKAVSKINEVVDLVNLKIPDDFDDRYDDMLRTYTEDELMNLLENGLLETFFTEFSDTIEAIGAEFQTDFDTLTYSFGNLERMFSNVIANATVDSEVILARGTEATLGARLDSTDAQLNEIEQRIDNLVATPVQPINTSFLTLVEDVNEIPKALKAASLQDFIDSTENIYLKDYQAGFDGALATSATYDTLKLFVEPGDVIRSKTFFYVLEDDSAAQLYYASFFREDGTLIRMDLLWFPESANPNWATLKENGLSAPEGTAFCYINLHNDYWYQKSELHPRYSSIATNGKEAEVITVNKDRTYTDFNEIGILPNYTPMEDHYVFDKDVEIRKYDEALGDIKTVLASLVEVS